MAKVFFRKQFLLALIFALTQSGCGTYTPDIQEFWGTPADTDTKLSLIVEQVRCELKKSIRLAMAQDKNYSDTQGQLIAFIADKWGADVLFQFTIDEKSSINPGASLTPPLPNVTTHFSNGTMTSTPQSETFGFGAQLSSEGYRQDKLHVLYKFSDLVGPLKSLPSKEVIASEACIKHSNADATLIVQSDLKLSDWLISIFNLQIRNQANFNVKNSFAKDGVIVHDIKFDVMSSGSFTPTWKLVRVSANTGSSSFLSGSRDRMQEVIITLAPLASDGTLKQSGRDASLASQIKAGLNSAIIP